MRRGSGLALGLSLATTVLAIERQPRGVVNRVEAEGGAVHEGRIAKWRKDALEVDGPKGRVTVPFAKVVAIEEADDAPPGAKDVELAKLDYAKRAREVAETDSAGLAKLGTWARGRGLAEEAKAAFEKAIAADPENKDARAALGHVKDGGAWRPARDVFAARREAAGADEKAVLELGRFGKSAGLFEEAVDVLRPLAIKDPFRADLNELLKPLLEARRPRATLRLPFKGRWKADEDPTHHHEKKSYAFFALDFVKVDDEGRLYRTGPKRNEDSFSWDETVLAAGDGVVREVRDGHPDNPFGVPRGEHNGITIQHEGGDETWYIHLKQGSVLVKLGDKVKAGDPIARVGNSGNSGQPHLHFTAAVRGLSVPWRCESYKIVTAGGVRLSVKRGRPAEGLELENE